MPESLISEFSILDILESLHSDDGSRGLEDEETYLPSTSKVITSPQYVPPDIRRDLLSQRPIRIINKSMPRDSPLYTDGNTAGLSLRILQVFAPKLWERFHGTVDGNCCVILTDGVADDAQLNTLLWWMRECMENELDGSPYDEMDTGSDVTEQSDWQDNGASSTNHSLYPPLPPLFTNRLDPPRTTKWIDSTHPIRLLSEPLLSESITTTLLPLLDTTITLCVHTARNEIVDMLRDLAKMRPLRTHELEALIARFERTDKLLHRILSCIGERFSRQHTLGGEERAFLDEHRELLDVVLYVADFDRISREKSLLFGRKHEELDMIVREARSERILGWLQGLDQGEAEE